MSQIYTTFVQYNSGQLSQSNVFKKNIKYKPVTAVTQSPTQKESVSSAVFWFMQGHFSSVMMGSSGKIFS